MAAPKPYDEKGPALITLDQLTEDFPVSPVFPFEIAGELRPVQFRLLSSAEKKRIKRQAEIFISQDYAELEGVPLDPGEVSNWIGTSGGIEAVLDEWRLRTVVASACYEHEPGRYAPIFDGRESAREKLSDEQIDVLDSEAMAHQMAYDPDEWSVEMFAELIDNVKKKGSGSSIRYGAVNQDACITLMVHRLSSSALDKLLQPESDLPSQTTETTKNPSTQSSD